MRSRWQLSLLWLGVAVALGVGPLRADEKTSLALPSISPGFAAIYVAQHRGLWAKQGLDVIVSQIAGIGTINAVIAGSIDFSGSTAGTLIRAAVAGQRMLAIANFTNRPIDELVVRKDVAQRLGFDPQAPLQKRLALIKGLTIAVDSINSINHAFLRYAAARGGLDPNGDVTVAPMQAPTMAAAMMTKSIDGFAVAVPWTTGVTVDGSAVAFANVRAAIFLSSRPSAAVSS